jgi:PST family polysaccharide transporter
MRTGGHEVTTVGVDRGSGDALAVDDRRWRVAAEPDLTAAVANAATAESHVKSDARLAARALHDAMAGVDAREPAKSSETAEAEVQVVGQLTVDAEPGDGLRTKVAGGVRWSLIATVGTLTGRMAFVVVLTRLLGPENFGIVAQATVYITVAWIFLNFGLPVTIIQRRHLGREDVGTAMTLTVASGLVFALVTAFGAPLIADFFQTPELTAVMRVLSVSLLLKAIAVVPAAMLAREMRFKALGTAEIVSMVVSGGIAIIAAVNGASYWALVVQMLVLDSIYLVMTLATARVPMPVWSHSAAQRLWSFSSRMMGSDVINYISDSGEKILIARFLGATPLALYNLAGRVLVVPIETLGKTGDRVILPMFSRLQDDRERVAHLFLQATASVALFVSLPMALVILCAPLGVPMVFGEAWEPAVLPLQLLAAHGVFFLLVTLTNPVVQAAGRADWELRWSVFTTVIAVATFVVGIQWGIAGVAACFLVQGALLNPIRFVMVQRLIPVSVGAYLRQLAPAATSTASLAAVWLAMAAALRGQVGELSLLVGASLTACVAFPLSMWLFWRADLRRQIEFIRQVVRPGSPS